MPYDSYPMLAYRAFDDWKSAFSYVIYYKYLCFK